MNSVAAAADSITATRYYIEPLRRPSTSCTEQCVACVVGCAGTVNNRSDVKPLLRQLQGLLMRQQNREQLAGYSNC